MSMRDPTRRFVFWTPSASLPEGYFDGRTPTRSPREEILAEVLSWPGVTAGPGRRGEFAFKVGRAEIGHLHGEFTAHFAFPQDVWAALIGEGRVVPHPLDRPGLAARRIQDHADVREIIDLLRLSYDRIRARHGLPSGSVA
jgi:hypothetical protein